MTDQIPKPKRRTYSTPFRLQLVAETRQPGASIAAVARRHDLNANVLFGWLRDPRYGGKAATQAFLPVEAKSALLWREASSPEHLDLVVEFPGGIRITCRDERGLLAVLRAIRLAT